MTVDTVTVPISAIIFLGGIIVSFLGSLFSICAHILLSIRKSLSTLVLQMGVRDAQVEARLSTVERHDANNEEDKRWAVRTGLMGGEGVTR